MKKKRLREYPPVGTVICFPLRGKGYAYAVKTHNDNFWHYNFVTDRPVADGCLFKPARWFQHVTCLDEGVGADTMDITVIPLSEAQLKTPKTWRRVSDYALQKGAPTPYTLYDPDIEHISQNFRPITEEELPKYQEELMFTYKKWMDWLESQRDRLEHLVVPASQAAPAQPLADNQTFEPASVFEIWLSELEKMELTDFDDIKDAIEAELDDHDAGEVIGSGHVVGDDQHNIAVKNAPGKRDEALACIRRVLLRLKASPETSIWEQRPDKPDHIDHPLIAPVQGQ